VDAELLDADQVVAGGDAARNLGGIRRWKQDTLVEVFFFFFFSFFLCFSWGVMVSLGQNNVLAMFQVAEPPLKVGPVVARWLVWVL
jgi:hypothetical protein